MARSLTVGMLAETKADMTIPAIFAEVHTLGGTIYFWSGYGTLPWNGHDFIGTGELLQLSPVTELSQVQSTGVTMTLSGIPTAFVALILASMGRYLPVYLWIGALDSNFNVVADPYQFFSGLTDAASLSQQGPTCTATITGEGRLNGLMIPRERRYDDRDQRIERPYDGGFKFVEYLQDAQLHFHSN